MFNSTLLRLHLNNHAKRCISYLSKDYNNVMQRFPQSFLSTDNVKSESGNFALLIKSDNRSTDLLDQLIAFRKQHNATSLELLPSVFVQLLMTRTNTPDLLEVVCNRLQYGVFLDKFVASYLLNYLLDQCNFKEAAKIAAQVVEQNHIDNALVVGLSLKACYEYIGDESSDMYKVPEEPDNSEQEVIKVRVKFLRNIPEEELNPASEKKILGEVILKLSAQCNNPDVKTNFQLIGSVLSERFDDCKQILSAANKSIYKDVAELCQRVLKDDTTQTDLLQALDSGKQDDSIKEKLNAIIKGAAEVEEPKLIATQIEKFQSWSKQFEEVLNKHLESKTRETRISNIEAIKSNLTKRKEDLFYFEEEDNIDIKIFKKKVYYPKRWFGKKKVPKVIDNLYVPPEVQKKNVNA